MQAAQRHTTKPARTAERRAETAETKVRMTLHDVERITADLAEMRQDRDRWRAQAEKLAGALDRLKLPATTVAPAAAPPAATALAQATGDRESEDLLHGVPAIARAFRLKARQVYHLKAEHGLPTFKIGRTVCASRQVVAAWLANQALAPQGGN